MYVCLICTVTLKISGIWYLCSLVETILIYQQFNKPGVEQPAPKQELVDFWMDFLVEATKKDISSVRFPVLILEPTKVYQTSYLSIHKDVDDNAVSFWNWKFPHNHILVKLEQSFGTKYFEGLVKLWCESYLNQNKLFWLSILF